MQVINSVIFHDLSAGNINVQMNHANACCINCKSENRYVYLAIEHEKVKDAYKNYNNLT